LGDGIVAHEKATYDKPTKSFMHVTKIKDWVMINKLLRKPKKYPIANLFLEETLSQCDCEVVIRLKDIYQLRFYFRQVVKK
jgi:hypothetical protein